VFSVFSNLSSQRKPGTSVFGQRARCSSSFNNSHYLSQGLKKRLILLPRSNRHPHGLIQHGIPADVADQHALLDQPLKYRMYRSVYLEQDEIGIRRIGPDAGDRLKLIEDPPGF